MITDIVISHSELMPKELPVEQLVMFITNYIPYFHYMAQQNKYLEMIK